MVSILLVFLLVGKLHLNKKMDSEELLARMNLILAYACRDMVNLLVEYFEFPFKVPKENEE